MSVDKRDKVTATLPGVAAKRGRPATGKAKTAAERQAAYRQRLLDQGREIVSVDLPVECSEALRKHVQFKDMTLVAAVEKIVRDRLLRKR